MQRSFALALAAGLLSCSSINGSAPGAGSDAGGVVTTPSQPLPCDVRAILSANCNGCHADPPLYGAPVPLVTLGDLHAASHSDGKTPMYQQVHVRIHDDARPMPPPPNARLSASDAATLDAWIARGAPAGDGATCGPVTTGSDAGTPGAGTDGGVVSAPCVADTHIAPTSPYTMVSPETYACYGFDVPSSAKRHVTEIRVRIDNPKIVHHVLLLKSPTPTSGTPLDCSPGPTLTSPMIYAWAPGGLPLVVPPEAGFPQDGSTHYLVQIHYNNAANAPSPKDATGFDLCTTDVLRKYDADVVAFGSEAIVLPPHAPGMVKSCLTASASLDGRTLFAAFPHMHKLGKSISTTLLPSGTGAPIDLGTDAAWDFSNQPWVPISATIHTGDVVKAECHWDNTGNAPVTFGQGTGDEMCYSFTAYYPVTSPQLGWAVPASASGPCP